MKSRSSALPCTRQGARPLEPIQGGYMANQIDGQVGTLCSVVFGAAFKGTSANAGELSNFLDMSDDLLTEPLQIKDGVLKIRDLPGTGVIIDEGKLSKYRQDK